MDRYCKIRNFGFSGVKVERFISFQWRLPPWAYVVYRVVLALYAIFILIETSLEFTHTHSLNQKDDNASFTIQPWPFYLSNITYLVLTVYLTLHATFSSFFICRRPKLLLRRLSVGEHMRMFEKTRDKNGLKSHELTTGVNNKGKENTVMLENITDCYGVESSDQRTGSSYKGPRPPHTPLILQLVWLIFNISSNASIIVTFGYLILYFGFWSGDSIFDHYSLQLHVINSVIIFVEHVLSAVPIRKSHFIYTEIFGLIYLFLTLYNYFILGNKGPNYDLVLDWKTPGISFISTIVISVVIIPCVQLLLFGMYKLKMKILQVISRNNDEN